MRRLRSILRREDIFTWVNRYLEAGALKQLNDFPPVLRPDRPGLRCGAGDLRFPNNVNRRRGNPPWLPSRFPT
jgi:hypothetical protein